VIANLPLLPADWSDALKKRNNLFAKKERSTGFIAAVGALASASAMLAGYLLDWPPELSALVVGLIGAALAVWRSVP